jgi:hypothetical protein
MEIQNKADEAALNENVRFEQDVSEPPLSAADIIDREDADLDLLASLDEEALHDEIIGG